MRSSEKRTDPITSMDVRVGRHRAKLDEIRESLKAYEHETTTNSYTEVRDEIQDNGGVINQNSYRTETSIRHHNYPQYNATDLDPEEFLKNQRRLNGNLVEHHQYTTNRIQQFPSPSYHDPSFQRPPPPAYDASPSNTRATPVMNDNFRTHLHIKTQPAKPQIHQKPKAPMPPGAKSTVSIETNVPEDYWKNGNTQRLYHTSIDQKTANSIVSINVPAPHTTKIDMGEGVVATKSYLIGPKYTTGGDRTKIFLNYTDELRQDPRMIASTSGSNVPCHVLFKPPNLDITFQPTSLLLQDLHNSMKTSIPVPIIPEKPKTPPAEKFERSSSPIDRTLLDSYAKNTRKVQPCKPNMLRFYMEQHVERLIQQYCEREKRMRQLEKEMNSAQLPPQMREKMLEILQQKESRYTRLRRQKMSKSNFTVISHIGVGAFGKVSLVRKKDTGKVYAMKSLEKADVIMKQQAAHVKAERDILAEADSPWIVRLFFSFQDEQCLYFIMEYVPGGDMMTLLIQKGVFEESLARFYIAELTCAIEYVHSVGFIHRDIKPDNILIDQNGHIKLTDFGLCTGLRWTHDRRYYGPENDHQRVDSFSLPVDVGAIDRSIKVLNVRQQTRRKFAQSVVGTGNYMAPEVITGSGHTQLCDWWSMGVILYEMVFGRVPFYSEKPQETQHQIVYWWQYLDLPFTTHLSQECLKLVRQLICDDSKRLGVRGGASQIKNHSWFKNIDFENLRKGRAEFIPSVAHDEDTSNFETFQINDKTEKPNVRGLSNPAFYEFTYRHFFDTDSVGCPSLRPTRRRSLRPLLENGIFEESVSEEDSSHI